jgi:hypothetical protein
MQKVTTPRTKLPLYSFIQRYSGVLFPVFLVVALLPTLVVLTSGSRSLNLFTRAAGTSQLRLFFEPTTVITRVNQPAKLTLSAGFDSGSKIIPGFSATFSQDKSISVYPARIEYKTPFRGRVFAESIEVIAATVGTYKLEIPAEMVITNMSDVEVRTVPATIIVQP